MSERDILDVETRLVQANVRRRLFDRAPVTRIGRYRVERRIGQGGMGVVFEGRDEALKRRVALKLLRGDRDEANRERMRREAEALAKLSHPNVVQIYGVEEFEGQLCLALELVEGRDLADRLRDDRPPRREILRMFLEAGRGLAAAHQAGLVHRDFKPANVLVEHGGRVRVTDFGTVSLEIDEETSPGTGSRAPSGSQWSALTLTGSAPGTPRYMSPEQHDGARADPRSDIYSFCLAAWEALSGVYPFPDTEYWPMVLAKQSGTMQPESGAAALGRRIRRVLLRGLEPDPARRPTRLEPLLDALEPRRSGRWWAGAAVLAVIGGGLALANTRSEASPCAHVGDELAATWNDTRENRLTEGFERAPAPYGAAAQRATMAGLNTWATAWQRERVAACEAFRVHGVVDEPSHAQRVACLGSVAREVDLLLETTADAEGTELLQVPGAVTNLSDPGRCAEDWSTPAKVAGIDGPDATEALDEILRARNEAHLARYSRARTRLDALEGSRSWEGLPVLHAALLYERGSARAFARDAGGLEDLHQAVDVAEAHRADEIAAEAWIRIMAYTAVETTELQRAEDSRRRATAAVSRLGNPTALRAWLHHEKGVLAARRGRYAEAEELFATAYEERASLGPRKDAEASRSLHAWALATLHRGEIADALELLDRAARAREVLGEAHPFMVELLATRGQALSYAGQLDEAQAAYDRAAALVTSLPWASTTLQGEIDVGRTELALIAGELETAQVHARQAYERLRGRDSTASIDALCNLGSVELLAGKPAEARPHLEQCARSQREVFGEESRAHGEALNNLGEALFAESRLGEALVHFTRSRTILAAVAGEDDFVLGYPEKGAGLVYLAQGNAKSARPLLESAHGRLVAAGSVLSPDLADLAWGLARARAETGASPDECLPLAHGVLALLPADGASERRTEIREFIAELESTSNPPPHEGKRP